MIQRTPWRSPDLGLATELADALDPRLTDALSGGDVTRIAVPVGPDLWMRPILTPEACARLTAVVDDRLLWRRRNPGLASSPNSMHYAGVILEPIGLAPAATRLRQRVVEPLRRALYPEFDALDDDYAFVATYGQRLDQRLNFHVDDSEVTLNISLGASHSGGRVVFLGRRCALHRQEDHRPEEEVAVDVPAGHGLLHAGSHRHLVETVVGERRNLIIWCRSSGTRLSADPDSCPTWCGHQGR